LHKDIALAVEIDGDGVDEAWPLPACVPFGGEGRFAAVERLPSGLGLDSLEDARSAPGKVYAAILVTPALTTMPKAGAATAGPDAGVLEAIACIRGGSVGGWNSHTRRPAPLRPVLPAGAVLFMRVDKGGVLPLERKLGDRTEWGYGRWIAAKWS
jgi:hypothetical protein